MTSDAAVCALFARTRWKMLRGVLRSSGSQKVAVVIGMVASAIAGVAGGIAAFVIEILIVCRTNGIGQAKIGCRAGARHLSGFHIRDPRG